MPVGKFNVFVTGIEQYARPGTGAGNAANCAPGKQLANVSVKAAPDPLPSSAVTNTGFDGSVAY
jgi:hypothetical protein